jgi:hypothetical protein
MMKKLLLTCGTLAILWLTSGSARADYICGSAFIPVGSGINGSFGFAAFSTYSAPHCAGSFIGTWMLCSASATSTSCVNSALYRAPNNQVMSAVSDAITRAAIAGSFVGVVTTTCNGGSGLCAAYINYQ